MMILTTYLKEYLCTVITTCTFKVFYSPTNAQRIALKCNIKICIKIAPTCFGAVTPSSGSALFVLAKVTLVKIVNYGTLVVMWLHILVGPCWCVYDAPTRTYMQPHHPPI